MKKLLATAAVALALGSTAYADETVTEPNPGAIDVNNLNFQIGVLEWVNPETEQPEQFFYYVGDIADHSAEELEKAMQLYPDVKKIALESPGGIADEASDMGNLFSDNGIQTWVPKGRVCLSACANAFIGGHSYKVSGILGFHSAWLPVTQEQISTLTPDRFNALYGNAQWNGVFDSYYWMINGFSIQMPAAINAYTTPDKFLVFLSEEELLSYYVRDDGNTDTQPVFDYMRFDDTRPTTVWGGVEMVPYLNAQYLELEDSGVPVSLVAQIYPVPAPEVETDEEVQQ